MWLSAGPSSWATAFSFHLNLAEHGTMKGAWVARARSGGECSHTRNMRLIGPIRVLPGMVAVNRWGLEGGNEPTAQAPFPAQLGHEWGVGANMIGTAAARALRWAGHTVAAAACAALAATGIGATAAAVPVPASSAAAAVPASPAAAPAPGYAMAPHVVADDPVSKILGATTGPVHKRVDGVWFPSPVAPPEAERLAGQGRALVGPGTPILVGGGDSPSVCTVTVAGRDAGDRLIAVTAGHCGAPGAPVRSMDAVEAGEIGSVQRVDATYDYAVLVLNSRAVPSASYGDTRVASVGELPGPGEIACKQGVATGRTCGPAWIQGAPGSAADPFTSTQICAAPGDSGAPVFVGDRLVAMVKGAASAPACLSPWQGPVFAPTIVTSVRAQIDDMNLHGGPGGGFRLA